MKKIVYLVLAVFFFVSACSPITPTAPPAVLTPTSTNLPAVATDLPATETPVASATPSAVPTVAFTASPPATCQVEPVIPAVDTLAAFNVPPAGEGDHSYGTVTPKVTILAYCNYQSPVCRTLVINLAELQQQFKDEVRVVLRQYPQSDIYDKSLLAAYAAESASLQGRFWEMNNLLYSRQSEWANLSPIDFKTWLGRESSTINLDPEQLAAGMEAEAVSNQVALVAESAAGLEIKNTPVIFYNNILVNSRVNLEALSDLVDYFLLPERAYQDCPPVSIEHGVEYTATFATEKGDIVFELFADRAPVAVNSFIFLAREGWFNDSTFYRVIPGFVAQGGDPSNTGLGGPGYAYSLELDPSLRFDQPGVLALSHNTQGMSGSQFFITYAAMPELDGEFTIIGRVVQGMEVFNSLRPRNPQTDEILLPAEKLISIMIQQN